MGSYGGLCGALLSHCWRFIQNSGLASDLHLVKTFFFFLLNEQWPQTHIKAL